MGKSNSVSLLLLNCCEDCAGTGGGGDGGNFAGGGDGGNFTGGGDGGNFAGVRITDDGVVSESCCLIVPRRV